MSPVPESISIVRSPTGDPRVAAAVASIVADLGSKESERAYREEWARFLAHLAERAVSPIGASTHDVQIYLNELRDHGKRQSTRARALAVVRAVYAALARAGVCDANPAREAKNPKGDHAPLKTPWLTAEEIERFLGAEPGDDFVERRDYLISMTFAMTGLRRAEVARVAVEALEIADAGGACCLKVRVKGGKHGRIELVAPLALALRAWAEEFNIEVGPIFRRTSKGGPGVGLTTVRNAVKRQAERAKFTDDTKFTPHAFRRSVATIAKQRGESIETVQRALLHSKRDTTERYMKLSDAPVAPAKKFLDLLPAKMRGAP